MNTALAWFRRDLRLTDHPALRAAAERADHVVAVYVHAPGDEGDWPPGAASRWWLHRSLARLDESLRRRGIALTIRRGRAADELAALAAETGARLAFWNRLHDPALRRQEGEVAARLGDEGVACESFEASLLHDPARMRSTQGAPYRVFTPFWRSLAVQLDEVAPPRPAPERLRGPAAQGVTLESLGLEPRIRWDAGLEAAWTPGEAAALGRLDGFLAQAAPEYVEGRNRPDVEGSSRLSPHLHFGEVGVRQCLAAARTLASERPSARGAIDAFLRELGWREFAHHLLHHFPHTAEAPLDERFARYPWSTDRGALEAWQRGRTGVPLVDAGLRELWTTGWMHNRVRMVVASFLTKNLRQPWLEGARWFWDTLVDADLANNTLGWQWTTGCGADAAPYFRVFNPVLQAERHDPGRAYLRRWLPELARLPDAWIHRPWTAPPGVLAAAGVEPGRTYPWPIVDLAASRAEALTGYARVREAAAPRGPGPRRR